MINDTLVYILAIKYTDRSINCVNIDETKNYCKMLCGADECVL